MNCLHCGRANLQKKPRARIRGEYKGEEFTVTMEGLACPKCGFTTVDGPRMAAYMRLVADAYRSRHGLLTSQEIRERRRRLGLSQAEFARHLGVGVASVKRWEMGRVQGVSSNELLRLRTDVGTARQNLEQIQELVSTER